MSLDGDIRLLSRVRLFAGFTPDQLRLLAFGAEARTLGAGTRIYRQGTYSDGGYVIVHGSVDLVSGPNDSIISSHGPASLIGEMALIAETNHAATAIATAHTEVLKIPRPLFRRMLEEFPEVAMILHERIAESVSRLMQQLDVVSAKLDHASDLATRPKRSASNPKAGDDGYVV